MDYNFFICIRVQCLLPGMILPMLLRIPLLKNVLSIATIVTRGHSTGRVECPGNACDGDSIASPTSTSDCFPVAGGPDADTLHGLACPFMSLMKNASERFTYCSRLFFFGCT